MIPNLAESEPSFEDVLAWRNVFLLRHWNKMIDENDERRIMKTAHR